MLTDQQLTELADYVRGTCLTIDEALAVFDVSCPADLSLLVTLALESEHEIMRCDCCGWWCDCDEVETDKNDEVHCLDCVDNGDWG